MILLIGNGQELTGKALGKYIDRYTVYRANGPQGDAVDIGTRTDFALKDRYPTSGVHDPSRGFQLVVWASAPEVFLLNMEALFYGLPVGSQHWNAYESRWLPVGAHDYQKERAYLDTLDMQIHGLEEFMRRVCE